MVPISGCSLHGTQEQFKPRLIRTETLVLQYSNHDVEIRTDVHNGRVPVGAMAARSAARKEVQRLQDECSSLFQRWDEDKSGGFKVR